MSESVVEKYHQFVKQTYNYNFEKFNLMYLSNGLGGECGEVQNEVKKLYRLLMINPNHQDDINSRKENIKTELGDMLWYMFAIANELDIKIDDIIANNMSKNTHNVDIGKN